MVKREVDADRLRLWQEGKVLVDVNEVVRCCGQSELAKGLYAAAGIDASEELEAPAAGKPESTPTAESSVEREAEPVGTEAADSRPKVSICDAAELDRRIESVRYTGGRETERVTVELETVKSRGLLRPLAQADEGMMDALVSLAERFPNLREVIEFVRRQVRLCLRTRRKILRLPPALLVGPPGTGKTRLLEELSGILGVELATIDCGGLTASFVISGSDSTWSSAKAGRVFEILAGGATLNPLVLLDEVDKLGGEKRYDPYGPLHTLLERNSARRFSDEHVKIGLDASRVMWFATANKVYAIPDSILSRLKRFEVRPPSAEEMAAVVRSVYADLTGDEDLVGLFSEEIPGETVATLSLMTPRQVREALDDAMSRASWADAADEDGRLVVLPEHVRAAIDRKAQRRTIGFAADIGRRANAA